MVVFWREVQLRPKGHFLAENFRGNFFSCSIDFERDFFRVMVYLGDCEWKFGRDQMEN